jgi:hypothetical protein
MAYSYDEYNPLELVGGQYVRSPSVYNYNLKDVSAADAGRTEDALMHKKRIAQKVTIQLAWNNISTDDASAIMNAFNDEYIEICYLDLLAGAYLTKVFYVGDRAVPAYNARLGLWSNVAFNIIER